MNALGVHDRPNDGGTPLSAGIVEVKGTQIPRAMARAVSHSTGIRISHLNPLICHASKWTGQTAKEQV